MTWLEAPAICSSISHHVQEILRSFVEDGSVLAVICGCTLLVRLRVDGWRNLTRSARRCLRSSEKRFSWRSLSSYGTWRRPLTSRVARRWTLSSSFISALSVGALASIAYSRWGRTKAQHLAIKAALEKLEKGRLLCSTLTRLSRVQGKPFN